MATTPHYSRGKYRAAITGQGFGKLSNEKQTPFFFFEFEPFECVTEGVFLPETLYRRELRMFITDKAIDYTLQRLDAMGFEGSAFRDLDPNNPGFHDFRNVEIEVVCSHQQADDKVYENWNFPSPTAGESKESDPSVAKSLDSLFGKSLKARKKPTGKPVSKAADDGLSPLPAGAPSDDIPF